MSLTRKWGIIYWLIGASVFFTIPLILLAEGQDIPEDRGCTTVLLDEYQQPIVCVGVNLATISGFLPPNILEEKRMDGSYLTPLEEEEYDWQLVDIYYGRQNIFVGDAFALYFDRASESLIEVPMEDPLTELAHQALDYAPEWLYDDLYTNFSDMSDSWQDKCAQAILSASHPYVDEVAFQVANISYNILRSMDLDLLEVNAQLLYNNDSFLNYVNIKDYGSPPGDYYSTVEYCVEENGSRFWIEAPKEIYYWYVVHPKCSDEMPRMDDYVYNEFWREFLFDYTHEDYLDRELFDLLSNTEIVWDRQEHNWDGGRPFHDDDMAVDVIGNWVSRHIPNRATYPRYIQPNLIITDHDGNCGELQDLLCAGTRTSLIPCISTMDICEDHVWCEIWDEGWHPYQVSWGAPPGDPPAPGPTHIDNHGICYDYDQGSGKEVSGIWDWRNDEYNYQVTDRYSEYCTLTVTVKDIDGNPVDGAWVRVSSHAIWGPLYYTAWDTTDSTGVARFILGDDDPGVGPSQGRDYYLRVDSRALHGGYPDQYSGNGVEKVIDDAQPGAEYELEVQLVDGDPMPQLSLIEAEPPNDPVNQFKVEIDYSLPWEYKFGKNVYAPEYKFHSEPGNIEFFICDEDNYQNYQNEEQVEAFMIREDSDSDTISFMFPTNDKWYMVFSNYDQVNCYQITDIIARLYIDQNTVDVKLREFYAHFCDDGVEVYWETEGDIAGLKGWNLYRQSKTKENKSLVSDALITPDVELSSMWHKLNSDLITGESPYTFLDTHVIDGEVYVYKLEAVFSDEVEEFGPITCDYGEGAPPTSFALMQNYPNPFTDQTTICYDLPTDTRVSIKVYNVAGQLVRCLVDDFVEAGSHQIVWDGRDLAGNPLASGVYIYRLDAEGFSSARRMVLCRW